MDILIESTRSFEKDLDRLSEDEKALAVKKINDCASLFPTQKADVYRKLRRLPLISDLNKQAIYRAFFSTLSIASESSLRLASVERR
jgi:hypothetical protein